MGTQLLNRIGWGLVGAVVLTFLFIVVTEKYLNVYTYSNQAFVVLYAQVFLLMGVARSLELRQRNRRG